MSKVHLKYALYVSHFFLVCFLIVFFHHDRVSLTLTHFAVISVFIALASFYRPRWAFWYFIGLLPFEALSLTEGILPLSIRPYQLLGFILFSTTILNIFMGRGRISFPRAVGLDICVGLLVFGGFVSSMFSDDVLAAFVQSVIILSFAVLYYLTRVFVTRYVHMRMPLRFFGISSFLIIIYSFVQNILFVAGKESAAVMPGRPNATFTEADWFGLFLSLVLAIIFGVLIYLYHVPHRAKSMNYVAYCFTLLVFGFGALILSVARSAWVGVVFSILTAIIILIILKKREVLRSFLVIVSFSFVAAYLLITASGLTAFDLGDRALSAGSGLQEITISCDTTSQCGGVNCIVPEKIESLSELQSFGCEHINLEDIEAQKASGNLITTTKRPDPNVSIRLQIYRTSLDQIFAHPFVGVGWGNIGKILGADESGTSLNSSNIVLQVWLGSGLIGLVGILGIIILLSRRILVTLSMPARNKREVLYSSFVFITSVALFVPNVFNAGLFMGILWVFLGFTQIHKVKKIHAKLEKNLQ